MSEQITILPFAPERIKGEKNGNAYDFVKQAAVVKRADGTGFSTSITPPKGAQPYAPGTYALDAAPFDGKNGLSFSAKLQPVAAQGATK